MIRSFLPSLGLLAGVLFLGCARALPPPGGERDETPPRVIATSPEHGEVITDLGQPVVFRFDERLSERGIRESILVSPETGEPKIEKGRSEIRVIMPGGWMPDQIYRVVLLAGVRDLFGNERGEPVSLVFSTGPEIPSTAIAGVVLDRLTGRPASNVIVQATRRPDSVVYRTVGDTSAFFALTHLPHGQYDLKAFVDQNRNRRFDPSEPSARGVVVSLAPNQDTSVVVLPVVPADTTPARLTRAEATDSLAVRVSFDDFLEPDMPLEGIDVELFALPDTTAVRGVHRLLRVNDWQAELRARGDTVVGDTAVAEADAARRQITPATPPGAPAEGAAQDTASGPLPVRELILVPATSLEPGESYLVRIQGVVNVSGVPGGGGALEVQVPARPPPATRPDTITPPVIPPDTTRAPPPNRRDTTITQLTAVRS